jgi:hypothetical protein
MVQEKRRRARYEFLGKRQKNAINQITETVMLEWLAEGETQGFNNVLGIIQDYADVYGMQAVNDNWKKVLQLPLVLFKEAVK